MSVYVSIGNSDDGLTQFRWSRFVEDVSRVIKTGAREIHGQWLSDPAAPWQNACWCFEPISPNLERLVKATLAKLAAEYGQDSIAWAVAETEFIKPAVT